MCSIRWILKNQMKRTFTFLLIKPTSFHLGDVTKVQLSPVLSVAEVPLATESLTLNRTDLQRFEKKAERLKVPHAHMPSAEKHGKSFWNCVVKDLCIIVLRVTIPLF